MTGSRLLEGHETGSARMRLAMSWPPGSSHCDISRHPVSRREDDAPLITPWQVLDQTARSWPRLWLSHPHIDVVSVVEHKEPPACAFLAQVTLHKSLYVYLIPIPTGYAELLSNVHIRLMKAFYVSCGYPDDREIFVFFSYSVD